MNSQNERLGYLLKKYAESICTNAELKEFFLLIGNSETKANLAASLKEVWQETNVHTVKSEKDWEDMYQSIINSSVKKNKFPYFRYVAVAASLLFVVWIGFHVNSNDKKRSKSQIAQTKSLPEILPGSNKAVLTLAGGKKIILDGEDGGIIASEAGIRISKTANGQLIYQLSNANKETDENAFNTIDVPKGGHYQVIMADGTAVWLNAMSSLRYPVHFNKNERKVILDGEGYFQVAKNNNAPFKVETREQTIEVLGTHFNVNAYQDENAIKTTLLEGSVKIKNNKNNKSTLLTPGEQASFALNKILVKQVDVEFAVAWKNGNFIFNNDKLEDVMRTIERWYDIDVEFKNEDVKHQLLSGSVSRFDNASQVFEILQLTGAVHFKIEGRRVLVM